MMLQDFLFQDIPDERVQALTGLQCLYHKGLVQLFLGPDKEFTGIFPLERIFGQRISIFLVDLLPFISYPAKLLVHRFLVISVAAGPDFRK